MHPPSPDPAGGGTPFPPGCERDRYISLYPLLARNANLGLAHWRLMAPGAARTVCTGTNAQAQCIRARQVHKCIHSELASCTNCRKHATTSDKQYPTRKLNGGQSSQSRNVCCSSIVVLKQTPVLIETLARLHRRVGAPTAVAARRNGRAQRERAGGGPVTICNAGYAHWSQGEGGEASTPLQE